MRLSRLSNLFKQTAVFYPLVAAAIIVPNLVLGVYGYWAITSQQNVGEDQLRGSYRTVLGHLNRQMVAQVQRIEEGLPSRLPQGTTVEEAARRLWSMVQTQPLFIDCFLVGPDGKLVMAPLPNHPAVAAAASTAPTPLPLPLTAPLPDSVLDAMAQRRQRFLTEAWPKVSRELGLLEIPSHLPLWDDRTRQLDTFFVTRLLLGESPVYLVAWLDLNFVRDKLLAPQIATLTFEPGLSVEIATSDPISTPMQTENVLVRERADRRIAPHWILNLKVANLDQFRQTAKIGVTLYVALAAMCLPFVVLGSFVMIRSLMKDIREARQKTDFVSRVTHELKTPLTSIRLFIETLQMGANSPEDTQRCLDIILQESERLSKLIERVLDLSKMESGNKVYHFREDDFEAVVRDTIEFFRKQASEVGGVIKVYIERNLPRFSFDRDGVREVLLNLLENAIKYSFDEKTVWIRVTKSRQHDADAVQVQVIDNGMGIRKDDHSRIFEKFYRCDDTLTRGIDGSGLGLTVSREIAHAHGGDIVVESEYGRGAKFTLTLPMRKATG